VPCALLEDCRIKAKLQRKFLALYASTKLQRKFLALYASTNFGYYLPADGTTMADSIKDSEGVTQGCNFGTLLLNPE
jgi:hypothetical protein